MKPTMKLFVAACIFGLMIGLVGYMFNAVYQVFTITAAIMSIYCGFCLTTMIKPVLEKPLKPIKTTKKEDFEFVGVD